MARAEKDVALVKNEGYMVDATDYQHHLSTGLEILEVSVVPNACTLTVDLVPEVEMFKS